jgi:hypothetical protein
MTIHEAFSPTATSAKTDERKFRRGQASQQRKTKYRGRRVVRRCARGIVWMPFQEAHSTLFTPSEENDAAVTPD